MEDSILLASQATSRNRSSPSSANDLSLFMERMESLSKLIIGLHQSIFAMRALLEKDLEENRKVGRASQQALAEVNRLKEEFAGRLIDRVAQSFESGPKAKLEALLDALERLIRRLEIRGGSPFRTAQAQIIEHLLAKETIGGKHTPWESALRTLDGLSREVGNEALKDLIRQGIVQQKTTGAGMHVSLVPRRLKDARRIVEG